MVFLRELRSKEGRNFQDVYVGSKTVFSSIDFHATELQRSHGFGHDIQSNFLQGHRELSQICQVPKQSQSNGDERVHERGGVFDERHRRLFDLFCNLDSIFRGRSRLLSRAGGGKGLLEESL